MSIIDKSKILITLQELNNLYKANSHDSFQVYVYSKVAILELGGWVQATIEAMTEKYYYDNITDPTKHGDFKKLVSTNSGFHYVRNVENLLRHVVGVYGIKNVEDKTGTADMSTLKSFLDSLTTDRNDVAHNYERQKVPITNLDAPSKTIQKCKDICRLLEIFEDKLNGTNIS